MNFFNMEKLVLILLMVMKEKQESRIFWFDLM